MSRESEDKHIKHIKHISPIYEPTEPCQPVMSDGVSEDRPQHRELRPLHCLLSFLLSYMFLIAFRNYVLSYVAHAHPRETRTMSAFFPLTHIVVYKEFDIYHFSWGA